MMMVMMSSEESAFEDETDNETFRFFRIKHLCVIYTFVKSIVLVGKYLFL